MARASIGPHDLGGLEAGPLDVTQRSYAAWERETHAVVWLLVKKGYMTLDEMRRATEALPGYDKLSYYEKLAAASAAIALERGTLQRTDLDVELGEGAEAPTKDNVSFSAGDCVRVRSEDAAKRWRQPHLRTPGYIFGRVGVVERPCVGSFHDPERVAFREDGPRQQLYRVRFFMRDIWELYEGGVDDTVDVEIYAPWLQSATSEELAAQRAAAASAAVSAGAAGRSCCPAGHAGHADDDHSNKQEHAHTHAHEHEHGAHEHVHEGRGQAEQAAIDLEGDDTVRRRLPNALKAALLLKGVFTAEEMRVEMEALDARGARSDGARLVARAWVDREFRSLLLQDAAAAAEGMGIWSSNLSPAAAATGNRTVLTAVANEPGVHNLVVCTLCSCYPLSVLGMPPHWYRSRAYRARAVRDPSGLLAEFGTVLPEGTAIRVHDSTADLRYLVVPERPPGTDDWSEERLAALVTRDSLIGVAQALTPAQLAARETAATAM